MSMLVQEPCLKPPDYCFHFCEGGSSGKNDKNMDYVCPICFDLISEAHITRCGHTFCYSCLLQTIEQTARWGELKIVIIKRGINLKCCVTGVQNATLLLTPQTTYFQTFCSMNSCQNTNSHWSRSWRNPTCFSIQTLQYSKPSLPQILIQCPCQMWSWC